MPEDEEQSRYFNISNVHINMPVQDGRASNSLASTLELEKYRSSVLKYENITVDDHLEGLYPTLYSRATYNDTIIYRNVYLNTTSNYFATLFVQTAKEVIMDNVFFEKAD